MAADELRIDEAVVRKDLGQVLLALEAAQDELLRRVEAPADTTPTMTEAQREAAMDLLRDPRLLDRGLVISIVVLRRSHGVDHHRADLDARTCVLIRWTLLRHFRLAGPIARLASCVLAGTWARALVTGVVLPLALAP